MTGRNVGKTCRTHYRGTFNDGTQFDSSYDRGEPLEFVCGAGQMIKGFDAAVADMEVGEIKEIHLMPEEAYGMPNPNMILTLEIANLPGSEDLEVGQQVYLTNQSGLQFMEHRIFCSRSTSQAIVIRTGKESAKVSIPMPSCQVRCMKQSLSASA